MRLCPAEIFGDLISSDHKVLSEGCESRKNHRYAVYPWKTKTSQEKSSQKFLEPNRKLKVMYTDNSLEFGNACEDLSWNHCTSTPHRSETIGIAKIALRRNKEGTSAVLFQSGLDENGGRIPWNVTAFCDTFKISCLMKRHLVRGGPEYDLEVRLFRLERW